MTIGLLIRRFRESRGLTQGAFADTVSTAQSRVSAIESGSAPISAELARQWEQAFDLPVGTWSSHAVFAETKTKAIVGLTHALGPDAVAALEAVSPEARRDPNWAWTVLRGLRK